LASGTNCHLANNENEKSEEQFQAIKTAERIGQQHQVSEKQ
jgi:hypothetical protein